MKKYSQSSLYIDYIYKYINCGFGIVSISTCPTISVLQLSGARIQLSISGLHNLGDDERSLDGYLKTANGWDKPREKRRRGEATPSHLMCKVLLISQQPLTSQGLASIITTLSASGGIQHRGEASNVGNVYEPSLSPTPYSSGSENS